MRGYISFLFKSVVIEDCSVALVNLKLNWHCFLVYFFSGTSRNSWKFFYFHLPYQHLIFSFSYFHWFFSGIWSNKCGAAGWTSRVSCGRNSFCISFFFFKIVSFSWFGVTGLAKNVALFFFVWIESRNTYEVCSESFFCFIPRFFGQFQVSLLFLSKCKRR